MYLKLLFISSLFFFGVGLTLQSVLLTLLSGIIIVCSILLFKKA